MKRRFHESEESGELIVDNFAGGGSSANERGAIPLLEKMKNQVLVIFDNLIV